MPEAPPQPLRRSRSIRSARVNTLRARISPLLTRRLLSIVMFRFLALRISFALPPACNGEALGLSDCESIFGREWDSYRRQRGESFAVPAGKKLSQPFCGRCETNQYRWFRVVLQGAAD